MRWRRTGWALGTLLMLSSGCSAGDAATSASDTTSRSSAATAPAGTATTGTVAPVSTTLEVAPTTSVVPSSSEVLTATCDAALESAPAATVPVELDEISGLAASRAHDGVLWAIEDSLNAAEVYALGLDGSLVATIDLDGAANFDWEDIALGPGPDGRDWIYVFDIGDNLELRDRVEILRFPEPDPVDATVTADSVIVAYDTGSVNAEAAVVGPSGVWVIGKVEGDATPVFHLDEAAGVLRTAGSFSTDPVTGADLSADGATLAVRTYGSVRLFEVPGGDVAAALTVAGCPAPAPDEVQGESIALLPQGATAPGLVTVSESPDGSPAELHVLLAR